MLKIISSYNITVNKNTVFFLSRASTHYRFTFSSQFLYELKHMVHLSNKNISKATNSFALRPLIFKLQQEVWKFNDICVSWSTSKTYPYKNFLNLENLNFEYVTFPQ